MFIPDLNYFSCRIRIIFQPDPEPGVKEHRILYPLRVRNKEKILKTVLRSCKYFFRLRRSVNPNFGSSPYKNILPASGLPEHCLQLILSKPLKSPNGRLNPWFCIRVRLEKSINPPDLKHTTARYGFKEKIILKKYKITVELVHGLLSWLGVLEADEPEAFVLAAVIGHDLNNVQIFYQICTQRDRILPGLSLCCTEWNPNNCQGTRSIF